MDVLALAFAIEIGGLMNDTVQMYDPPAIVAEGPTLYTDFAARFVIIEFFYVGGGVRTYARPFADRAGLFPMRDGFTFEAGALLGPVRVGLKHYCTHPIVPYSGDFNPSLQWDKAYTDFFVSYESKILPIWRKE
jgi:hypothetical protein